MLRIHTWYGQITFLNCYNFVSNLLQFFKKASVPEGVIKMQVDLEKH